MSSGIFLFSRIHFILIKIEPEDYKLTFIFFLSSENGCWSIYCWNIQFPRQVMMLVTEKLLAIMNKTRTTISWLMTSIHKTIAMDTISASTMQTLLSTRPSIIFSCKNWKSAPVLLLVISAIIMPGIIECGWWNIV